jgi:hypothetical protein
MGARVRIQHLHSLSLPMIAFDAYFGPGAKRLRRHGVGVFDCAGVSDQLALCCRRGVGLILSEPRHAGRLPPVAIDPLLGHLFAC